MVVFENHRKSLAATFDSETVAFREAAGVHSVVHQPRVVPRLLTEDDLYLIVLGDYDRPRRQAHGSHRIDDNTFDV
jgi:hypothetical protein